MRRLHDKNNFLWLTGALIGLLVVGAYSRDAPESLTRPMAEVLVILEAIVGMFYLAIIVASMVGAMSVKNEPE